MKRSPKSHEYESLLTWDGNLGLGTASYAAYGRDYHVRIRGKPDLLGSADAAFRGASERHNPEDLFLAAVSSCHMLAYLALCARRAVRVLAYEDAARGHLALDPDGGGRFTEITLRPRVVVATAADERLAFELHEDAHRQCFIASSSSAPIHCEPTIEVRSDVAAGIA